jgi:CRISPR-associated protein Cmr1
MAEKVRRIPVHRGMKLLKPLLKIKFWNSSPLLLGGYNTESKHYFDGEELRPTSLKGVWRWWFRAVLGAELWRDGVDEEDFIRNLRRREGAILGTAEEKALSSRIVIRSFTDKVVYDKIFKEKSRDKASEMRCDSKTEIVNLPKIRHLTVKGREISFIREINGIIELKVISYRDEEPEYEDLKKASGSFILSLLLSGLGKGSRRGLGSLDFEVLDDTTGIFSNMRSENIDVKTLRGVIEGLTPASHSRELPPIPILSPDHFELLYFKHNNVMKVLGDIQGFTLRAGRYQVLGRDPMREKLIGWILGLPRGVMKKDHQKPESGYYLEGRTVRRASPLVISVHKTYASICLFRSKDWPLPLLWKSPYMKGGIKASDDLIGAYNVLSESVKEYLKKCGYEFEEVKL